MSRQANPTRKVVEPEEKRKLKGRRDKLADPKAEDFKQGDMVYVEVKETNGFTALLDCQVVDSYDFQPLRTWTHKFVLMVRVMDVVEPRYAHLVGHLVQVQTDRSHHWGTRLRLVSLT
jgi:hypothetical protein